MQRIDENTYIDDTLVTCAEYQLFIDEMRDQVKFFQPDHWTSFLFQEGKATEPILGVRFSDAQKFCEWLSKRESIEWVYRLATPFEVMQNPIKLSSKEPVGYWIIDTLNKNPTFTWVDKTPSNARILDQGLSQIVTVDRVRSLNLDYDIEHALKDALNRPIDIDFVLYSYRFHDRFFDRTDTSFGKIAEKIEAAIIDARNHVYNRADARLRGIAKDLARNRKLTQTLVRETNQILFEEIKILIDIFTLQERILGRSPAFEGIRIIKTRVR